MKNYLRRGRAWTRLIPALSLLILGAATSTAYSAAPAPPACATRAGAGHCIGPKEMRTLYGVDSLLQRHITGKGVTIAIIVSFGSPTIRQDLHEFDVAFGLSDPSLEIRSPLGTAKTVTDTGWRGETTLDVEWAHAIAPGAKILLLTSPVDETEGTQGLPQFLKLEQYALAHSADIINQSWAATEDTLMDPAGRKVVKQFHAFYKQATKAGVTIVSGSGDDGAAGLDNSLKHFYPYRVTQYPASDPLVLAVGGTSVSQSDSGRTEVAWSGSGGGFSKFYGEPSYQKTLPAAAQTLLHGRRGVPDVAFNGARETPVPVRRGGNWYGVWGTSASTPQWSGIVALADSLAGKRLGDLHAALYGFARSDAYGSLFNDITSGEIRDPAEIEGTETPLHAAPGWDPTTGLGSPKAAALVPALAKKK